MAEDADLAQLRAARMAELQQQQQQQQQAAGGQQARKDASGAEDAKQMMLAKILTKEARARLNGIRVVKAEKAEMVEMMLIRMAQTGQLPGQVNEDQLKGLLAQVSEQQQKKTNIKFTRHAIDDDDDDDHRRPGADSDDD